ncbi:S-layer homology domain-containing protein [Paenibacillus taiwanensis]|uniref:S-layer homology domain-containing protein n=1 Tax=Paenibacillus taiwanensis TaxID=401638 RepID=UPI0004198C10|nr:S-layer homology domain-containing protein [Paenibacillus taiwanensis]
MKLKLIATLTALILLVSMIGEYPRQEAVYAEPQAVQLVDTKGHWGEAAITKAVQAGYVNGYPNQTFKPNGNVTRAEFIRMVVGAMSLSVPDAKQGQAWYKPFVNAAAKKGLYMDNDYPMGDMNTAMTRIEMARVAVRSVGESAANDAGYMVMATKKGLISGMQNGSLAALEPTTRAQSVVVIDRILRIQNGEMLPVDEKAVKNAEIALNAPKDPWGRAIRTTNLPKNYKDFPYVLEKYPNKMYEMEININWKGVKSAVEITKAENYSKEAVNKWIEYVGQWGMQQFNVNYKTIDNNWLEKYINPVIQQNSGVKNSTKKYVDWVKKNQIQIEGNVEVEPSIIQYAKGSYYIRTVYTFRIINYKEDKEILFDPWYEPGKFKKNQWYIGYADIPLVSNVYMGTWSDYKISTRASFMKQENINKLGS